MFRRISTGALAAALSLSACAPLAARQPAARAAVVEGETPEANLRDGCVADYRPGVDYFPEKARFSESDQLSVSYHGHYKRVIFAPAVDTREVLRMVLVQCGTPTPTLHPREIAVQVPVRSFATANISLLGAAVLLGASDRIVGVSTTKTSLPSIEERMADRRIVTVHSGVHGNAEQAAALAPDLFFTFYSAYPEANTHPLLRRLGVKAVPQSDHTESTPLGRAEWIKYLALFVNAEAEANAIFEDRRARYAQEAARVRDVAVRPLVQLGAPEGRDEWAQAGGRNFFHRLVEDAGGRHAWADQRGSGSLTYARMETLYDRAGGADVWVGNYGAPPSTLKALRRDQPQLAWTRPVHTGQVVWFDAGRSKTAAARWSDQGMTEPQDALADLVAVLHPERAEPGRKLRFIRRVPGGAA